MVFRGVFFEVAVIPTVDITIIAIKSLKLFDPFTVTFLQKVYYEKIEY